MCGIVGYVGNKKASEILLEMLEQVEYRGYDSAGIAVYDEEHKEFQIVKTPGRVIQLQSNIESTSFNGTMGIGHTRWATHGEPNQANAHPHWDNECQIVVVHNGIIENFKELKSELSEYGHTFHTQTDTEVIVHLIAEFNKTNGLAEAVRLTVQKLKGAFAIAVLSSKNSKEMIAARYNAPLVVGKGENGNFISSDIPALMSYTNQIYPLDDGEISVISENNIAFMTFSGEHIEKEPLAIDWSVERAQKDGFPHFLLKEIYEQPKAIVDTLTGRLSKEGILSLEELDSVFNRLNEFNQIQLLACGTASYVCMYAQQLIERNLRLATADHIGSEYRYKEPLVDEKTLLVTISQSGETADTIAGIRLAQEAGAKVIAIANVLGSTIPRMADGVLYTRAGQEVAVPSTKAFMAQLVAVNLLLLKMDDELNILSATERQELANALWKLPGQIESILKRSDELEKIGNWLAEYDHCFVIGRSYDNTMALEGALKLKEIAYLHAEAQAGGELKHGSITLVGEDFPVIALATQSDLLEKMANSVYEVVARHAPVISIVQEGETFLDEISEWVFQIPRTTNAIAPILAVVALQLISYYVGQKKGANVDRPRNLAKSVTVE